MPSGSEASWAITLPNQFEPYGNVLQRSIESKGQQNQLLYQEMLRQRQQQQNNERYNINLIQEETKAKDLATGNTTFDNWLGGEYDKSLKEIMSMPLSEMPPSELFVKVKEKFSPLTETAMRLKNTINTIDEYTKLVGSEMSDIDTGTLSARAKEMAINDLMPINKSTGSRDFMPKNFKPDINYVDEIMSSPNSWELVKDGSKFTDFIKNYKTSPISFHKQFADKSMQGYTGKQTPFRKLSVTPDENSRIKSTDSPKLYVDVQDDFITEDGKSKSVKILSDAPYQLIQSNQQAARGLNYLWEKYKKENNIKYDNPVENEKRKRQYAANLIETADVSEIIAQTPTHLPRIYSSSRNYINIGSGSKVNDVEGRMKKTIQEDADKGFNVTRFNKLKGDEQTLIKDFINKDLSQEDKYGGDDILVSLNSSGQVEVYKKSALIEGKNPNTLITTLPDGYSNLKAKQPGKKENEAIIAEGNNPKYKQITETNKGTIGVKDGKWYYIKTGKPVE